MIATGSSPSVPDAFSSVADHVLTNETIFELADLPRSLAVVRAGPLGLELAQGFARLGVKVAVFDQGTTIAGLKDGEVEADLRCILEREFPITTGVEIRAEPASDGARLSWKGASEGEGTFERVLVSAGRPPCLATLDLEAAGLELDEHGTPAFDRNTLKCGSSPVFIAGDADHDRPVLHEAAEEARSPGATPPRSPASSPRRGASPSR